MIGLPGRVKVYSEYIRLWKVCMYCKRLEWINYKWRTIYKANQFRVT